MSEAPHDFFAQRGFELTFSVHTDDEVAAIYAKAGTPRNQFRRALASGQIGPVFANLRGTGGVVLTAYGTGQDEASAAARAMQRWKQEQGD